MKEFENAYVKNAGGVEVAKQDSLSKLKTFLDLYINFKMKLRDAQVRGFDQDSALNQELTDYKKKVGVTYLLEKNLVDPGLKDLYEKRKWEYRVSHLMIRPDSSGEEGARKLAQSILDSIKAGKTFESRIYSPNLMAVIFFMLLQASFLLNLKMQFIKLKKGMFIRK
jgi:peptidyl-prolyl cis-trans isomerase SurA